MPPKRSDDPDPFAETPLAADERRDMLETLADHMKPILQTASEVRRAELQGLWDELRDQETVESFRSRAELLLARLGEPDPVNTGSQTEALIGGFLAPSPVVPPRDPSPRALPIPRRRSRSRNG